MCPPPLNEDITAQIASYLDSPDAHRLALTSRVFYTPATQHALKDVTIRSFTAAMQFFDYMLHDMSDRLPCLRCLRILCPMESDARFATPAGHSKGNYKAAASLLADLLEAAPGLRVLALHSAPVWMANERRISSAITSMRHLQELEFTDIGRCVVDTLFRLRSTPHKLTLADARQNRYPYALRNVSAQSALGRQGTYRAWLQYGKLAFQSVRELTVDALYDLPPASHLARLFPNVREVNFGDNAAELPWVGRKCSNSSYASRRVVAWPSLECVRGTGCGLKSWWNAHPVHCLELLSPIKCAGPTTYNGAWGRVSADDESEDVLMAMHNLQPVALLATFSAEMGVGYLRSLFAASQRVRYVALEVWEVYRYETWLMDLSKWWTALRKALLLHPGIVALTVRCSVARKPHPRDAASGNDDPPGSALYFEEALASVRSVLPRWAATIPSLRYIYLDLRTTSACLYHHREDIAHEYGFDMPRLEDCHPHPSELYGWSIDQRGKVPVTRALTLARSEAIVSFLCSSRYDWNTDHDRQLAI